MSKAVPVEHSVDLQGVFVIERIVVMHPSLEDAKRAYDFAKSYLKSEGESQDRADYVIIEMNEEGASATYHEKRD